MGRQEDEERIRELLRVEDRQSFSTKFPAKLVLIGVVIVLVITVTVIVYFQTRPEFSIREATQSEKEYLMKMQGFNMAVLTSHVVQIPKGDWYDTGIWIAANGQARYPEAAVFMTTDKNNQPFEVKIGNDIVKSWVLTLNNRFWVQHDHLAKTDEKIYIRCQDTGRDNKIELIFMVGIHPPDTYGQKQDTNNSENTNSNSYKIPNSNSNSNSNSNTNYDVRNLRVKKFIQQSPDNKNSQ